MYKRMLILALFLALITPLTALADLSISNEFQIKSQYNPPNQPPNPPIIDGPTSGRIRTEHFYTFTTIDPDGNMLMTLEINWGEGVIDREGGESCANPWESGREIQISHRWNSTGNYSITARVQDVNGDWSDWSDPFEIKMPLKPVDYLLYSLFQKHDLRSVIKNIIPLYH